MEINSSLSRPLSTLPQPNPAALTVRVLSGNLLLSLGDQLDASVLHTTDNGTLLNVQGKQVLVDPLPDLPPGAEVILKAVPGQVGQRALQVQPLPTEFVPALPNLTVGKEIVARVADQLPGGRLLLDVQGTPVEATAPEPLPIGTQVSLRVASLQPQQVVLDLIDRPTLTSKGDLPFEQVQFKAIELLVNHLPDRAEAGEALTHLQQAVTALVQSDPEAAANPVIDHLQNLMDRLVPPDRPPTAENLAAFVREGGLHYEAKLADSAAAGPRALAQVAEGDVKGQLLQLLRQVEAPEQAAPGRPINAPQPQQTMEPRQSVPNPAARPSTETSPSSRTVQTDAALPPMAARGLAQAVASTLSHVEAQQALNLLARLQGEPIQLQIPFFNGQQMATAFLAIQPDGSGSTEQEGRASSRGHDVLFLLDLEQFGRTRIDAHFSDHAARVIFYLEQGQSLNEVQGALPDLQQSLKGLGYPEVLLEARSLGQMPAKKQQDFAALRSGVPASTRLVDLTA
jgi:hypothetical protein